MILNTLKTAIAKVLTPIVGKFYALSASDRYWDDLTRNLSPQRIDAVLSLANSGNPSDQARLAQEILEKNWDVAHAVQTRRNAICACDWELVCDDKSKLASAAMAVLKNQLISAKIDDALRRLSGAVLIGYSAEEIIWLPGGRVGGFEVIPAPAITFADSFEPLLQIENQALPQPIPHGKILFHQVSTGTDATRGGLIRPIAWLHLFSNASIKDFMMYIERYGMPMPVWKVAQGTPDEEVRRLQHQILNFGNGAGAVVSSTVSAEFANISATNGELYLSALRYFGDCVTKVLLGQTASSGDASGWSKGSAQAQVRQDILDADCRAIESTINAQLIALWQSFNFPQLTAPIEFKILSTPPDDEEKNINVQKAYSELIGIAGRAGVLTPSPELEECIRKRFKMPKMSEDVLSAWADAGNVRAPITLQSNQMLSDGQTGEVGYAEAVPVRRKAVAKDLQAEEITAAALAEMVNNGAITAWEKPVVKAIESALEDDEKLKAFLQNPALPFGDAKGVEEALVSGMMTGTITAAELEKARALRGAK